MNTVLASLRSIAPIAALAIALGGCTGGNEQNGHNPELDQGVEDEADAGSDDMGDAGHSGTAMRFEPASTDFFSVPFPSDARRREDGSFGFRDWPQAGTLQITKFWMETADELLDGWGLVSGVFVYFDAPIDPASLPETPEETTSAEGGWPSVFLMDVDPDSEQRGRMLPLTCKYTDREGTYHAAHQLGCHAPFGVVREPNTRYAFVVTSSVTDADGDPVEADEATRRLLDGEDVDGAHGTIAAAPYTETRDFLVSEGLGADTIAGLAIFTTGDPVARLLRVNEWYEQLPDPVVDPDRPMQLVREYPGYVVLEGWFDLPRIQQGPRPYNRAPAGKIVWGDDDQPVRQDTHSVRFYVTIPKTEMPDAGYPIMNYHHGSGGKAEQLMDRGYRDTVDSEPEPGTGPAMTLARYGIAGFATDFALHGDRFDPPDTSGLKLYNLFGNPRATVDNFIVAANEVTLQNRLIAGMEIDPSVAPDQLGGLVEPGQMITFDAGRLAQAGQSMGTTIGLPAATIDRTVKSAIFAGAGGVLVDIAVNATTPVDLNRLLRTFFRYRPDEVIDVHDTLLHGVQHVWDFVDPTVHARHVFQRPHTGVPPKHTFQFSGLTDGYFSPESRAAFSMALGAPLARPVENPDILGRMALVGLGEPVDTPVQANMPSGVTAFVRQYQPLVQDGHYVMFQRDDAKEQYACFIATLGGQNAPILAPVAAAGPDQCGR